ncbi:hypothetical protein [Paraburkholderia pallida]|uniref:Uncharacterized protein n=1 Tax=Paraburkholderia pallida TaxID=2547399 RepID=A0A4P7CXX1_9BURK|nr:hypothetical protein [Paraburkholderia pallida]QBR00318.1 hypothetical protein E1956_25005 [Paraburkholderia pallida]
MKRVRVVLELLLVLVLALPVFVVVTRIDAIPAWLYSDRGYATLEPLFNLFGAVGIEGHEDVIVSVLLALSLVISGAMVAVSAALLQHRRRSQHRADG